MTSFLDGKVRLLKGDCLELLPTLEEGSIDSCVTDPPYHLTSIVKRYGGADSAPTVAGVYNRSTKGFMGKQWDGGDIAFNPTVWQLVFRALKPGAHLLAFSGTRTYHRMACAIEDAGFEIRDQIGWCYGSGFPKSHDISKGIDRLAGAKREVVGQRDRYHDGGKRENAGPKGNMLGNNSNGVADITAPATESAIQWQGWGTALKPAWEPIVLARKPLSESSIAANVLRHGTGAINVDGCRVETDATLSRNNGARDNAQTYNSGQWQAGTFGTGDGKGRWPANLIHDGSEEVVNGFPESLSAGKYKDPISKDRWIIRAASFKEGFAQFTGGYWVNIITPDATYPVRPDGSLCEPVKHGRAASSVDFGNEKANRNNYYAGNSGSAARFFYTAKADQDDRLGSKHPTVKPLDLIQYLVRLITPQGGCVLDPFAGTGTAGEASWREGFYSVLIEREPEYQADIERRMALVLAGPDERMRETVKARGEVEVPGPLFAKLRQ